MARLHDLYNDRTVHHGKCTTHQGTVSWDPNEGLKDEKNNRRGSDNNNTANKARPSFTNTIFDIILTHPLPQIVGEHQVA